MFDQTRIGRKHQKASEGRVFSIFFPRWIWSLMTSAKRCYNGSGDSAHVQPPETLPSPRKCPHQAPMLDPTVKQSSGTATTEMKKPKREMETNLNWLKWLKWLKSLNDAAFARSEVALFPWISAWRINDIQIIQWFCPFCPFFTPTHHGSGPGPTDCKVVPKSWPSAWCKGSSKSWRLLHNGIKYVSRNDLIMWSDSYYQ